MFGTSQHILRARELAAPDGRPLCRYAVTDDELRALIDGLDRAALDPRLHAADFCLLAAEAWRRRYDGGPWTWDVVLPCVPTAPPSPRDLADLVTAGLRAWRRPLLQLARREFLGSIAREAGLPSEVITRDSGRIRAYLKALITDLRTFGDRHATDLARQHEGRLPNLLRTATFRDLCVETAQVAIALAATLTPGASHHALNPADLDRHAPGWRDRFPLRLDDDAAIALVTGLVDVARAAPPSRPLRARVRLTRFPDAPRLHRALDLPRAIPAADLARLVDRAPADLPPRLDLIHPHDRAVTTLAHLVRQAADGTYTVEALADLRAPADRPLTLALRAQGQLLGRFTPPGGEPLTDLPWVFAPDPTTDHDWRLIAQGATRFTSAAVALLAPSWRPHPDDLPAAATLGDRRAYRLDRDTILRGPDATITLRAGAAPDDATYAFDGPRLLDALDADVFLGLPTLVATATAGHTHRVPPERLQVATPAGWRPASTTSPRGALRVRALDRAGALLHEAPLTCLPPTARLDLEPLDLTSGRVRLTGADHPALGVSPAPGLDVDPPTADTLTLRAPSPPSRLRLALRWPDGAALAFDLPFPRRGQRFITTAGATLDHTARLPLDGLHDVIAEAWADRPTPRPTFALEATLKAQDTPATPLDLAWLAPDRAARRHTLPLHAVARALERLFALSTTPNATVRLRLRDELGGYTGTPTLTVARFAHTLTIDKPAGVATLSNPDLDALALRIAAPETVIPLPRASPGRVELAPLADHPGAWMVFAADDARPVSAPRLRIIPGAPAPPDSALAAAVDLPTHLERAKAFRVAWHDLATHPKDPGWPLVHAWLARLDTFPITTFEALRVLPEVPLALARTLLAAADPAAFVRAVDALPFHWATLPAAALAGALRVTRDHFAALFDDALVAITLETVARSALDALAGASPGAAVLTAHATAALPELAPHFTRRELGLAAAAPAALTPHLDDALNALRQRHPDPDTWPRPRPLEALLAQAPPPGPTRAALVALPAACVPVAAAPLLAATCAATGHRPDPLQAYALRLADAFDPDYFAAAHPVALALALALATPPTPSGR